MIHLQLLLLIHMCPLRKGQYQKASAVDLRQVCGCNCWLIQTVLLSAESLLCTLFNYDAALPIPNIRPTIPM